MILEDLEYIFKLQIDEGTTELYFMLIENNLQLIHRYPADDLEKLLLLLDTFMYIGTEGRIPKFTKNEQVAQLETHKRTIVRTLSYRFTALLITAIWTGLGEAIAIHIILAIWQYVLERVWLKINWGKQ